MKIISPFTDYYDHVVHSYGEDESNVFVRKTTEHSLKDLIFKNDISRNFLYQTYLTRNRGKYSEYRGDIKNYLGSQVNVFVVGFCGKLYPGIMISEYNLDRYLINNSNTEDIEVLSYHENEIEHFMNLLHYSKYFWKRDLDDTLKSIKKADLFNVLKTPYFVITKESVYSTPILKNVLKFQSVIGPQLAYQEVEMFLSQMNNKEIETTSTDINKVVSHGFDKIWSFRNPDPPKRKMK